MERKSRSVLDTPLSRSMTTPCRAALRHEVDKRSVPTDKKMVGTAQARLCPPYALR